MIRLVGRVWVPMVMVLVVAVGAFTVSRLHGVFGSVVIPQNREGMHYEG
jgi:Mycobacterium membrane protein